MSGVLQKKKEYLVGYQLTIWCNARQGSWSFDSLAFHYVLLKSDESEVVASLQWQNSTAWHGWRFQFFFPLEKRIRGICFLSNNSMQIVSMSWKICCHSMWIIQEVAKEMNVICYVVKKMYLNMPFKNLLVHVADRKRQLWWSIGAEIKCKQTRE